MKQESFEARYADRWEAFEAWLKFERFSSRQRKGRAAPFDSVEAPARYRELCQQLTVARGRHYSPSLV